MRAIKIVFFEYPLSILKATQKIANYAIPEQILAKNSKQFEMILSLQGSFEKFFEIFRIM